MTGHAEGNRSANEAMRRFVATAGPDRGRNDAAGMTPSR
jgi:hypothetical protein